ncbi:MAG: hypothetical protein COZ37_04820 [bacterium (Candidatus Ratteibacteria) CG_4_10_14_3_um_filter_41_18]|uniref:Uncharacterized protein n=4 Tax=Candidatus Ratteibacteria TaxID=2979319 RepID=A0A2M7E740_9BACT|nr:MAG: hypothetical protein AUJ76_04715 [Candidatus Omnitrophica bacterium CG1_02_41_171]PIV63556.1 MAG: hypothetical protein COS11_06855 [bacterium (Candidatus Ratteibacteria) CG01_land_8_20_14_3_00_40_19]PIW31463.1 MAG: hypothetical protein COW28_07205 [bacterium (Candidatus Ratteibacteria) CG15_BIG_FIL_POST_REV_8_21_14_020_41_12]PIW74244.1 MAG: hypothetical protein CO004_01730 [bacterium (Candidatus Ratteibacteria) CG_4_8_14_3_um_filter_41_36]PIX77034.1 MAG: hypothetical protein COZ37_04820
MAEKLAITCFSALLLNLLILSKSPYQDSALTRLSYAPEFPIIIICFVKKVKPRSLSLGFTVNKDV